MRLWYFTEAALLFRPLFALDISAERTVQAVTGSLVGGFTAARFNSRMVFFCAFMAASAFSSAVFRFFTRVLFLVVDFVFTLLLVLTGFDFGFGFGLAAVSLSAIVDFGLRLLVLVVRPV